MWTFHFCFILGCISMQVSDFDKLTAHSFTGASSPRVLQI